MQKSYGIYNVVSFNCLISQITQQKRERTAFYMKKNCGYFLFFITEGIGGAFGGQGVLLVYTLTLFFGMNFIVAAGTRVIISLRKTSGDASAINGSA